MTEVDLSHAPTSVSPPGDTIADLLEKRDMRQVELARRLGKAPKVINEIIRGKAPISPSMDVNLEHVLGSPASFWLTRQARFDALRAAGDAGDAGDAGSVGSISHRPAGLLQIK